MSEHDPTSISERSIANSNPNTDPHTASSASWRLDSARPDLQFKRALSDLRSRRLWRVFLQTGAVLLTVLVALFVAACAYVIALRFHPQAVQSARFWAFAMLPVGAVALWAIVYLRNLDWLGLARYADRHGAGDEAMIVSALQAYDDQSQDAEHFPGNISGDVPGNATLSGRLLTRAADHLRTDVVLLRRERLRARWAASLGVVSLLAVVAAGIWGPPSWQYAAKSLIAPKSTAPADNPFKVAVLPGNAVVMRGEDLGISAVSVGFAPRSVNLNWRPLGSADWRRVQMQTGTTTNRFEHTLFGIESSFEYYVDADTIQSAQAEVSAIVRPSLLGATMKVNFPDYTGLESQHFERLRDIDTLVGSGLEVEILADPPGVTARLGVSTASKSSAVEFQSPDVQAETTDKLVQQAQLKIDQSSVLRIELTSPIDESALAARLTEQQREALSTVVAEFRVEAVTDTAPKVAIAAPGRDSDVTVVDEVDFVIQAEDDIGVRELELVLNVNGGEEKVVSLNARARDSAIEPGILKARLERAHTVALEELELQPGDLISYYARAKDNLAQLGRESTTDIFFLEIRHSTSASHAPMAVEEAEAAAVDRAKSLI